MQKEKSNNGPKPTARSPPAASRGGFAASTPSKSTAPTTPAATDNTSSGYAVLKW